MVMGITVTTTTNIAQIKTDKKGAHPLRALPLFYISLYLSKPN